jgi:two-component system, chemotaxis family, CheB/CheR fusion protein
MNSTEKNASTTYDLVIVGASAGGVEALSILVSTLPESFPVPIVLAQHLDPSRPSSLNLILQRRTSLPVEVVNTSCQLQAGTIYVVPSNRQVSIKDHQVKVHEDRTKRLRPSVDALFSTAAEEYGDRLIAVILTGSGSDGAIGAVDVKNAGRTIIVQDPQNARYPSMPLSLPPTIVDFEVSIEQLGELLIDLLNGASIPQTEEKTEDILREILEQVNCQAIMDFRPYKTSTILRRIGHRMAVTHCRTIRDYADYLKTFPEEIGNLVKAFLINVTQFFRDSEAFAYLKHDILPNIIARAREQDRVLRLWTAGCATGEEPYSLAILLTDLLGPELPEWSVKIFATDLDEATINFARRGLYSENLLKGMPAEYRNRFFERVDQGYRIVKALRQMVIFGQQDLSRSAPFPRVDLLLCRNVLIYFTPDLQDYVLNQFAFSLCPDGYLFLGKAETVRSTQTFYELVSKQWKIYRCIGNPLPAIRHQTHNDIIPIHRESLTMNYANKHNKKSNTMQELANSNVEDGQPRHFNELLLRFLPVGVIVIDRFYRVMTSNGVARRLLGLREVTNEIDFLHAVHGIPYQTTRAAIDAVLRERNAVSLPEIELDILSGGNGRFISLAMALMPVEAGAVELVTISVTDVTEQVQIRRQLEAVQMEQSQLMGELTATNKRLSDVNKELMDANEELQVANEELMLTHEELQASIEEFETTNEELQAINEELETNNEELQATNEELETTNDELRARTNELQEVATGLETERIRLAEIVGLAPFYILVLRGPNLIVDAYNPRYATLLDTEIVRGRALDDVNNFFWKIEVGGDVMRLIRETYIHDETRVLQSVLTHLPAPNSPTTIQGQHHFIERYFTYTIVPSHDTNGHVNGIIVYAVDETAQSLQGG